MKKIISLFYVILFIIIYHNVCFSQNKKFHQVIFGDNTSDFINYYSEEYYPLIRPIQPRNYDLILTCKADFRLDYLWIFNDEGINLFYTPDTSIHTTNVPQGTFNILAGQIITGHQIMILLKDSVKVDSATTLTFSKNEADKSFFLEFVREDYTPLNINGIALILLFNEAYNQGVALVNTTIDTTTFWFRYNKSLSIFQKEWSVKGKQLDNGGNLYLLNNTIDSVYNNLTITNDPTNFAYADFQYHFPDSVENDIHSIQVGTANYGYHWYSNDPRYYFPFSFRIMQDTTSDLSLFMSKFEQDINATGTFGNDIITAEMRIGANKVKGYTTVSKYDSPFLISETNTVHIGVTPTYYYGQCQNTDNEIRIVAPFNKPVSIQPFLSLTNDVLKHFPYNIKLFQNGNLLEERELNIRWGHPHLAFGCEPNDLIFSVPTGKYEITFLNDKSEVAGLNTTTTANLEFDLNQADKNPPNMTLFQILSDNIITHKLDNAKNNIVRFKLEDDNYLSNARLYYIELFDTIWTELQLIQNNTYFETQVPTLANGYYSLKTVVTDSSNNLFEMIIDPAFLINGSSSISKNHNYPTRFELYQNYPNPFNNETNIHFSIPKLYNEKINLSIYNILGQKIITMLDEAVKPGKKKYKWNGKNMYDQNVSSGIYILQLKGGALTQRKKIILLK